MTTTLFHSLSFADAPAAMEFLEAVGFTRRAVHADDGDPSVVVHAQYDWGDRGGIMFGTRRSDRSGGNPDGYLDSTGHAQCYCVVTDAADIDEIYARAVAAGGASVQPPTDPDYGGRSCTVRDREGNQFSFGTYAGE